MWFVGFFSEEDLDEATKQFNFWTHQLHIFFVRKFFPAAQRMLILMKLVQERCVNIKTRMFWGISFSLYHHRVFC